MLRVAVALLGLVTVALGVRAASPTDVDRAALIRLSPGILRVEARTPDGRFNLGSGVVVAPGRIVTNCHVTRSAVHVSIVKGGIRFPVEAQASDVAHDLCVLKASSIDSAPVPLASSGSLKIGEELIGLGFTGGVELQLSQGEVVGLHRWDGARVVQSTNGFTSGASGGALLTQRGELVGILTFRMRGAQQSYFSAPVDWLRGRIDDEASFRPVAPLDGQTFWELPTDRQPYFLQAASLEQRGQWDRLSALARRWERESPAEGAYTEGVAQDGLGSADLAVEAWRRCVELDPGYVPAWQRLARLYRKLGRTLDTQAALDRLRSLDIGLARALASELDLR